MVDAFETSLRLMRSRRSVRRFRPDPVDESLVEQLVEAARWAPSAANRQAWRLYSVTDAGERQALADIVRAEIESLRRGLREEARETGESYLSQFVFFAEAPLLLVAIHRAGPSLIAAALEQPSPDAARRSETDALCSVSAALTQLLLAAHALGLGACWMTGPLVAEERLARALQVPDGWRLSALVPVGYAAESPEPPRRRPVSALLQPARLRRA